MSGMRPSPTNRHGRPGAETRSSGTELPAVTPDAARRLALTLLLPLTLACGSGTAAAQGTRVDPCADLGSFVVVDPPPLPRGQPLVAQPYQPCADLPGAPQPQIFIDAQVPISPQGMPDGEAAPGTGYGPEPHGWDPRRQPSPLRRR